MKARSLGSRLGQPRRKATIGVRQVTTVEATVVDPDLVVVEKEYLIPF